MKNPEQTPFHSLGNTTVIGVPGAGKTRGHNLCFAPARQGMGVGILVPGCFDAFKLTDAEVDKLRGGNK